MVLEMQLSISAAFAGKRQSPEGIHSREGPLVPEYMYIYYIILFASICVPGPELAFDICAL